MDHSDAVQELPFHAKASSKRQQPVAGLRPESRLYGGGTLPPGFEHLESLRRFVINHFSQFRQSVLVIIPGTKLPL